MSNLEPFERLEPTYANGFAAQTILFDDYLRVGISEDDSRQMVNGLHGDTLETLVHNMEFGPREYYGIRENGILAGFASLGEWYPGDEQPFLSPLHYASAVLTRKMSSHAPTEHDVVHALAVGAHVDSYEDVAATLLDKLRQRSNERSKNSLYITVDTADEKLIDVVEVKGERAARKVGKQTIQGIEREYLLYALKSR